MTKDKALKLAREGVEIHSLNSPEYIVCTALIEALAQPEQGAVASVWDEGYQQGVQDERTSESNIGIAGFGAKVEPARQNPYRATPPQRKEPEQEPCGWQYYHDGKWHNGLETNNHRANTEAAGVPVRDVYPSPQRKPLTNAEIRKWWASENGFEDCNMAKLDDFEQVIRAVEGKHGIKGDA